jgi:hypothetical protein
MSTINLYEQLECTAANGTWAYTGTLSPAPSAPATYDGTVDFTGYDTGLYEYTYTTPILNKTVKVSIDWVGSGEDRIHNVYTGAITIPLTTISNIQEVYADNNLDYCDSGGFNKPTATSTTLFDLPTYFPANISGDLWYQVEFPVCLEAYEVNLGIARTDGLNNIGIVVHTYYPDISLVGAKEIKRSGFSNTSSTVNVTVPVDAKARMIALIRAFTTDTTLGNYTVNVFSNHTCTPAEVDLTVVISGIAGALQETFTADGNTNTYTVTKSASLPTDQDNIMVMRNGQFLQSDYFSHDSIAASVTLTFTPFANEEITIIWFDVE